MKTARIKGVAMLTVDKFGVSLNDVYYVNGDIVHLNWECLVRCIDPEVMTIEKALSREVR